MTDSEGASPWLFLFGLVLFLGSAALFVVDLLRGVDVFRAILGNGMGAVVLIGWAALDTLRDPDSEVATVGGAAGTALLLYGLYLLGTGVVVAATGLLAHDYLDIGLLYVGLSVVAVVVGYLIFPTGAIVDEDDSERDENASPDSENAE